MYKKIIILAAICISVILFVLIRHINNQAIIPPAEEPQGFVEPTAQPEAVTTEAPIEYLADESVIESATPTPILLDCATFGVQVGSTCQAHPELNYAFASWVFPEDTKEFRLLMSINSGVYVDENYYYPVCKLPASLGSGLPQYPVADTRQQYYQCGRLMLQAIRNDSPISTTDWGEMVKQLYESIQ
jgi:hypothetical protein